MKYRFIYRFMGEELRYTTLTSNTSVLFERMERYHINTGNIIRLEVDDIETEPSYLMTLK